MTVLKIKPYFVIIYTLEDDYYAMPGEDGEVDQFRSEDDAREAAKATIEDSERYEIFRVAQS